ncbi:HipA domain-containing protein [Comamonas sp. NoAH]|uniref:HipA domain-containing protein n=1 Tax=Comamonas halotolerans TaxID=3041496 RepID=UPI0032EA5B80
MCMYPARMSPIRLFKSTGLCAKVLWRWHAASLAVPAVHRLYVPEPAYSVKRFDRRITKDGSTQRQHINDTCLLPGKSHAFKYEQATLETLVQAIKQCTAKAITRLRLYH